MATAFSYARFSSAPQAKGSSLERQKSMVANWLAQNPGYTLSELTFQDLGKSGWKGEHIKEGGGFANLLAAVEAGAIASGDAVLVESVDRAGRLDTLGMLDILGPILRKGVEIITLDDGIRYTRQSLDGGHIYILLGKIQSARQYSDNLSRRLTGSYDSRRRLAKEGKTPKRNTPVWLTSNGVVIPEIAAQVKRAFELYISGLGKAVIARRMRESGLAALAKCSGPGVEGWLRNEAAIGRWDGSEVYPPIVDISTFHLAQIEGEKRKTLPREKTAAHFYVGLVKCGSCGHNYIMRTIRGVQVSMRCRRRQELKGCENKKVIPKEIIDTVYRHTSVKAAREAVARQSVGVNEKAIIAAEARLLELSRGIESLGAAIRSTGPIAELIEQVSRANEEREALKRNLALLKATVVPSQGQVWQKQGDVWNLERGDPQRLAAMLRNVGYAITIYADRRITSSHSDAVYRYAGVDRKSNRYRLYVGEKLLLVLKAADEHLEAEPLEGDTMTGEAIWTEADYESLQSQR
ncbi:recombinase family protein [Pseudomonas sp. Pdm06]|uniref:recombinase family protein n=1 Tax=Pseudomonas sp. Pdm06 TaxID=1790044 RepID=UPI00177E14D5|nr:recombinase family protein [Pseudomonas sp. Pdm06]MBD9461625.1 recombinase family protein [Pseudomonas sp. Pdm06]